MFWSVHEFDLFSYERNYVANETTRNQQAASRRNVKCGDVTAATIQNENDCTESADNMSRTSIASPGELLQIWFSW